MSQLDQHVARVRGKLMLGTFLHALAWTTLGLAWVVCIAIIIERLFALSLPHAWRWFGGGVGAAVVSAGVYAFMNRPTLHESAVAIDLKLSLKEKFSTALYARNDRADPFAQAAVKDAEQTAQNVSLHKRFPLEFPRPAIGTVGLSILAFLLSMLHPLDLLGNQAKQDAQKDLVKQQAITKKVIQDAIVQVQQQQKILGKGEAITKAQKDLEALLQKPPRDPEAAAVSARKALQDVSDAVKQQIAEDKKFAEAQNDAKLFKSMTPPSDAQGPVADAHRALVKGDFDEAVHELEKAVDEFKQMDPKQQQAAAQQMKQMAQALQQMANNNQIAKQLQKMGANQQQAAQMQQMMQQAAQGNQQAAQQLQQMAQQAMQQMNNGKGPTPAQQQQIQQMMQQMQAKAGAQQQAGQMGQAAQQMAQAMQQAAQGQPRQGNSPQGQQAGQQMANAQAQMQQQLQQMQALANDAQAMAAAQQNLQNAANGNQGNGGNNGQNPNANGNPQNQPGGNGQWKPGQNNQVGNGVGAAGIGNGARPDKTQAPYTVKTEKAPVQDIENGKILASFAVKAGTIKGEAKEQLKQIQTSGQREATDEVDQEVISRPAQETVKKYFNSIAEDQAATK